MRAVAGASFGLAVGMALGHWLGLVWGLVAYGVIAAPILLALHRIDRSQP